jgi:hypothetical protein
MVAERGRRTSIGMIEVTMTGPENTAEKETGIEERIGMFQVVCRMVFLAGGIQLSMVLTECVSSVGSRLMRLLQDL